MKDFPQLVTERLILNAIDTTDIPQIVDYLQDKTLPQIFPTHTEKKMLNIGLN